MCIATTEHDNGNIAYQILNTDRRQLKVVASIYDVQLQIEQDGCDAFIDLDNEDVTSLIIALQRALEQYQSLQRTESSPTVNPDELPF